MCTVMDIPVVSYSNQVDFKWTWTLIVRLPPRSSMPQPTSQVAVYIRVCPKCYPAIISIFIIQYFIMATNVFDEVTVSFDPQHIVIIEFRWTCNSWGNGLKLLLRNENGLDVWRHIPTDNWNMFCILLQLLPKWRHKKKSSSSWMSDRPFLWMRKWRMRGVSLKREGRIPHWPFEVPTKVFDRSTALKCTIYHQCLNTCKYWGHSVSS